MRILVVDDEPNLVKHHTVVLQDMGHDVSGYVEEGRAENIAGIVEQAARERFDVAVVDFVMPTMDGDLLAAEIRRVSPATRIVLLSDIDLSLVKGLERYPQVDKVLPKNWTREQMEETLKSLVSVGSL